MPFSVVFAGTSGLAGNGIGSGMGGCLGGLARR